MGLKYTKADGQALVSALDHNLSTADQIISDLQEGVERLVSCIGDPFAGLSGQAYHAADTLFRQLVAPMLKELKNATATIKSELHTYKSAIEAFDRYSDSVYDKTYFEHLLEIKRQQKALTENQLTVFSQLLATSLSQTATENLFFEGKGLESVLNHYEKEIQELEDKIHILEDVESRTSSLFSDSLQDFRYALLGAKSLRSGSFDSKGNFTVSKNIDMAWYKKLTGKDLDESLVSKKDNDLTLEDILTGNVSKENQATVEQLKKLAEKTGMTIQAVWSAFYKSSKNEFDKAVNSVGKHKVSDDDIIKTYTITYVDPASKVQHGMKVVYDETTGQVLSQKGWGASGEFTNSLKKYGGVTSDNIRRSFANRNPDVNELQSEQKNRTAIGNGINQLVTSILRAKEIDRSLKTAVEVSSGKEYSDDITRVEKEKKKQEAEREKEQRIKDLQTMSSGGTAYFGN